jgi:hypothetical protein
MTSSRLGLKENTQATQKLHTDSHKIPHGAVLLGVLKSVESELRRRELLGLSPSSASPLWFLAETERNVFLWRSGRSLDDSRYYSFWVDVPALITKRREQLSKPGGLNPFINPLWGSAPLDSNLIRTEFDYLETVEDLVTTVFKQAEALSHASESIRKELEREDVAPRIAVVLPARQPGAE